jgi:Flp pilus assembly protein TadB
MLELIEADLLSGDRRFADAMRMGRPRAPREYRRTWTIILAVLGVLAFILAMVTGHPLAVVALLVTAIVGLIRFVVRKPDAV